MSVYSPRPIEDIETVSRVIFSPIHLTKNGQAKSAAFSHAESKGCSINREGLLTNSVFREFVANSLQRNATWQFKGIFQAGVADIRSIAIDGKRAYCVYDIADEVNSAHSEVHMAYDMPEADRLEARAALYRAFKTANIIAPADYRQGVIHAQ